MSRHAHADYAPPRSWEQFEELCADIFQSAWRDPALVRHGRAGQRQNGVDIVARNGAIYPIGLQCKKRSKWPVSKLTTKQIDAEVAEALKFKPALQAFYILTTAPDDTTLLNHEMGLGLCRCCLWPLTTTLFSVRHIAGTDSKGFKTLSRVWAAPAAVLGVPSVMRRNGTSHPPSLEPRDYDQGRDSSSRS